LPVLTILLFLPLVDARVRHSQAPGDSRGPCRLQSGSRPWALKSTRRRVRGRARAGD
jgi:hypothetical protein